MIEWAACAAMSCGLVFWCGLTVVRCTGAVWCARLRDVALAENLIHAGQALIEGRSSHRK
jgi:hypothetical protein